MKFLFLGDVFGTPGRRAVRATLPRLIARHGVDLVIANAENVAGGAGVTAESARELLEAECNLLTSGNHIWTKREAVRFLEAQPDKLLRPINYPAGTPGRGWTVLATPDGRKLGVLNVEGRVFNPRSLDDPFVAAEAAVQEIRKVTRCIFVDMHCEATSEKNAMGAFLDGKVSAVLGSHTHIQTADERILPGGTAFITDVGMVGPMDSIIGVRKELALQRFRTQRPVSFEPAKNDVWVQGAVVDLDEATGRARAIVRVQEKLPTGAAS